MSPGKGHASLGEVVGVVLEVLTPNQSCQMSLQQFSQPTRAALEGLLSHYFSPYQLNHHMEDMLWFMDLANRQHQWGPAATQDNDSFYEQTVGVVAGNLNDDLLEKSVDTLQNLVGTGRQEHKHTHTYIHTYTHIHTYIHTYIHKCTHICILCVCWVCRFLLELWRLADSSITYLASWAPTRKWV